MILTDLDEKLIGLLPAAGRASRIQPLPFSKELLPIGFQSVGAGQGVADMRPKPVSQYLLESMHHAGAHKAYMVINRGKWDIPAYFGPGIRPGIDLAYVVTDYPYGAPFSVKQVFPFVSNATILFGFPDIRFTPVNAFSRLLEQKNATGADLVLGLFRAKDPSKMDMVCIDSRGHIASIDIKPAITESTYTWIIAAWSPIFTAFMQSYLENVEPKLKLQRAKALKGQETEYYVGHVIRAALESDIMIASVVFENGSYIDVGTPESLISAMTQMTIDEGEEKR